MERSFWKVILANGDERIVPSDQLGKFIAAGKILATDELGHFRTRKQAQKATQPKRRRRRLDD